MATRRMTTLYDIVTEYNVPHWLLELTDTSSYVEHTIERALREHWNHKKLYRSLIRSAVKHPGLFKN